MGTVRLGELDFRAASAITSLAGALVRTISAGELQERLRALEGRIKRLEREWDHPDSPVPNQETPVVFWASLWTASGLEASRDKAAALESLIRCQSIRITPTIAALNKWAHCESAG